MFDLTDAFPRSILLSILSLITLALPGQASAEQAPNGYRGPERDGISAEADWAPWSGEPKILWKRSIGSGYSAVTVYDGQAFTMGHVGGDDIVYCLDPKTGKDIWTYKYPCAPEKGRYRGPRGTPTVDDKHVYTVSLEGHILCLDRKSGKKLWGRKAVEFGCKIPTWGFACSPLVLGEKLYIDIGRIVALDRTTGKTLWQTKNFGESYCSPVACQHEGKVALATFPALGLVLVDAATGRVLGLFPHKTKYNVHAAMPIIHDGAVFITSDYNKGCSLVEIGRGRLKARYESKAMQAHVNTPVLHEGYLYGFTGNVGRGKLTCVDFKTGQTQWTEGSLGCGGLMLAGGKLIIQGDSGQLVIAEPSPAGYKPIAQAKVLHTKPCWTMPVLDAGLIYCRDNPGTLVCVDVRKP